MQSTRAKWVWREPTGGLGWGVYLKHSGFVTQLSVLKGSVWTYGSFEPNTEIN